MPGSPLSRSQAALRIQRWFRDIMRSGKKVVVLIHCLSINSDLNKVDELLYDNVHKQISLEGWSVYRLQIPSGLASGKCSLLGRTASRVHSRHPTNVMYVVGGHGLITVSCLLAPTLFSWSQLQHHTLSYFVPRCRIRLVLSRTA